MTKPMAFALSLLAGALFAAWQPALGNSSQRPVVYPAPPSHAIAQGRTFRFVIATAPDGRNADTSAIYARLASGFSPVSPVTPLAAVGPRRRVPLAVPPVPAPRPGASCAPWISGLVCDVAPGYTIDIPVENQLTQAKYQSGITWVCTYNGPLLDFGVGGTPPPGITVSVKASGGLNNNNPDCGDWVAGIVHVTVATSVPPSGSFPAWVTGWIFKAMFTSCTSDHSFCSGSLPSAGGNSDFVEIPSPPPTSPSPGATPPERGCGICNGTRIGKPIDVATGQLWNQKTDFALSGPFGLAFRRFYGNQTVGSADLGSTHWTHNYGARLDLSGLSAGNVTLYDFQGMPYYFTGVTAGGTAYDNITGDSLAFAANGSSLTLTTFAGATSTFNLLGQLTGLRDRIGNTQSIFRDGTNANRIATVTDSLGRQLCFYYDAQNRITSVAAWMNVAACPSAPPASSTSTPVVTIAYDTGTNCAVGDLCTVTEPDGNAWTYQYTTTDPVYPTNLSAVLDPLGDREEANTYSGNRVTHQESGNCTYGSPCPDTGDYITITYPTTGTTVVVTDGLGHKTNITYDPQTLLLTRIFGPLCKCGGDQTRQYTYDATQRFLTASDDGVNGSTLHVFTFAYGRDAGGRTYPGPTSITENLDALGTTRTARFSYYPVGDPRQDLPQVTTWPSVDRPGLTISTTDTYTPTGLLTQSSTTGYINGTTTTRSVSATYDTRGRIQTYTGPRTDVSQITSFGYFSDTDSDAERAGQLSSITNPLGQKTIFATVSGYSTYSPFGKPLSVTDPNSVSTKYVYDARGRMTQSILAGSGGDQDRIASASYDSAGRMTKITLPKGNGTVVSYDTSGRATALIKVDMSGAQHDRLSVQYNTFDQPVSLTAAACSYPGQNPCGSWTTTARQSYNYTNTSDLSQIMNADGTSQEMTFTSNGQLATFNDENHRTGFDYTFTRDLAGRLVTLSQKLGTTTVSSKYAYDVHDNLISVIDQNANTTTYHADDFDRVTSEVSPTTGTTTFIHNVADLLTSRVNANGSSLAMTYDALNRPTAENDAKGTAQSAVSWAYDNPTPGSFGIGRLSTMLDPSGSTTYIYDSRGNATTVNQYLGAPFTYVYAYDDNGNLADLTYPDGQGLSYSYDYADRPYSATPWNTGGLTLARRRPASPGLSAPIRASQSELPRLLHLPTILRAPAPASRGVAAGPRAIPATAPGIASRSLVPLAAATPPRVRRNTTFGSTAFVQSATYLPFGPMTSIAFGNGTTQSFSYNQRYLPVENKLVHGTTTLADHTYAEDAVGNITTLTDSLDSGYNRSFTYDDLNRITTANSGSKLWGTATGNGFTYDAMGNVKTLALGSARNLTFTYRPGASGSTGLPLLSSVSGSAVTYDSIGSEINDGTVASTYGARELLGSALPNISSYTYDGFRNRVQAQLATGSQRLYFTDPRGHLLAESALSTTAPTTTAYDYIWFGDTPIAQVDNSGTRWTHTDHLGTPMLQTDSNGAVYWQAEYEPYGEIFALRAADVHQPLRLPGQSAQQFDIGANGINQLTYNNARWYRPTWGRYSQADPMGLSAGPDPYAYASQNPLMVRDPSGFGGFGFSFSGGGELGDFIRGIGETISVGGGYFFNGWTPWKKPSFGGFYSGGAFASLPPWTVLSPSCPGNRNWVGNPTMGPGAYGGAGVGAFLTNANNVHDTSGPFEAWGVNAAVGGVGFSAQFSKGKNQNQDDIWVLNLSGIPPASVGFGFTVSKFNTNTVTTSGGGDCPCN